MSRTSEYFSNNFWEYTLCTLYIVHTAYTLFPLHICNLIHITQPICCCSISFLFSYSFLLLFFSFFCYFLVLLLSVLFYTTPYWSRREKKINIFWPAKLSWQTVFEINLEFDNCRLFIFFAPKFGYVLLWTYARISVKRLKLFTNIILRHPEYACIHTSRYL